MIFGLMIPGIIGFYSGPFKRISCHGLIENDCCRKTLMPFDRRFIKNSFGAPGPVGGCFKIYPTGTGGIKEIHQKILRYEPAAIRRNTPEMRRIPWPQNR